MTPLDPHPLPLNTPPTRQNPHKNKAADDFSSFLEKENELEKRGSSSSFSAVTPDPEHPQPLSSAAMAKEAQEEAMGTAVTVVPPLSSSGKDENRDVEYFAGHRWMENKVVEDEEEGRWGQNLEDVTRPMGRQSGRSATSRDGSTRSIEGPRSGVFSRGGGGGSLLVDHDGKFAGLSESEDERHSPRHLQRAGEGGEERTPSPVDASAEAVAESNDAGLVRLRLPDKRFDVV